jgi:hypothetical protein
MLGSVHETDPIPAKRFNSEYGKHYNLTKTAVFQRLTAAGLKPQLLRAALPKWRKVPQLPPQQAVQLEALPIAIQHPQQRCVDKLVAGSASFRFRETGDLHCQRKPESLECAGSHRIKQSPLLLGTGGDSTPQQSGDVMHLVRNLSSRNPRAASGTGSSSLRSISAPTTIAMGRRSTRSANSSSESRCFLIVSSTRL